MDSAMCILHLKSEPLIQRWCSWFAEEYIFVEWQVVKIMANSVGILPLCWSLRYTSASFSNTRRICRAYQTPVGLLIIKRTHRRRGVTQSTRTQGISKSVQYLRLRGGYSIDKHPDTRHKRLVVWLRIDRMAERERIESRLRLCCSHCVKWLGRTMSAFTLGMWFSATVEVISCLAEEALGQTDLSRVLGSASDFNEHRDFITSDVWCARGDLGNLNLRKNLKLTAQNAHVATTLGMHLIISAYSECCLYRFLTKRQYLKVFINSLSNFVTLRPTHKNILAASCDIKRSIRGPRKMSNMVLVVPCIRVVTSYDCDACLSEIIWHSTIINTHWKSRFRAIRNSFMLCLSPKPTFIDWSRIRSSSKSPMVIQSI